MYLLGVSTDSASDWVNRVQSQLNHVLTQGSKLDESGDWDQQANWKNRGIPLWVRDAKYASDGCELKQEEIIQKGQAGEAEALAAKRKSTGEEPAPKKKKTASKPKAAKSGTGEHTDESDGDEEEESEEEKEEEPQVSQGETAKKAAARPGSEESRAKKMLKEFFQLFVVPVLLLAAGVGFLLFVCDEETVLLLKYKHPRITQCQR